MSKALTRTTVHVSFVQGPRDWGWLGLCIEFADGRSAGKPLRVELPISGVFCPMKDYMQWLERLARGEHEVLLDWDTEGSDARLLLRGESFSVQWQSNDVRARVDRRQLVAAFYAAFRSFVCSPRYDPLKYERHVTLDEVARTLTRRDLYMPMMLRRIAALDARAAECQLSRLLHGVTPRRLRLATRRNRPKTRSMVLKMLGLTAPRCSYRPRMPGPEVSSWIGSDWNTARHQARFEALKELMESDPHLGYGSFRLRDIRSPTVEAWITAGQSP